MRPATGSYGESIVADLIGLSRNGEPVVLVEVKRRQPTGEEIDRVREFLHVKSPPIAFGMLVSPEEIRVISGKGAPTRELCVLDTPSILGLYDRDFTSRRLFEDYMTSLVEAWLRDIAYHWRFSEPPGERELRAIGLADLLQGGTTQAEVRIGSDSVP